MRMDTRETASASALDILPLPEFNSLTQQQVRGIACVWDGVPLSTATAVDLGERRIRYFGTRTSWFPRACHSCASTRAYQALLDHSVQCPLCPSEETAAQCAVGQGLYRLHRECRP